MKEELFSIRWLDSVLETEDVRVSIMEDFTVKISYKNKNLEKVNEQVYGLKQYLEMTKLELMRIIMDVEDSFIRMNDGKPKEEWDSDILERFNRIRHKLLDQANAVERLPNNLYLGNNQIGTVNVSDFLANMFRTK